jgi:hypothetical protein
LKNTFGKRSERDKQSKDTNEMNIQQENDEIQVCEILVAESERKEGKESWSDLRKTFCCIYGLQVRLQLIVSKVGEKSNDVEKRKSKRDCAKWIALEWIGSERNFAI